MDVKNNFVFNVHRRANVEGGKIFLNNNLLNRFIHLRSKEGLGYLPQQRSVFNMSVYDNILGIAQISIKKV